jgi:hypothetical protein
MSQRRADPRLRPDRGTGCRNPLNDTVYFRNTLYETRLQEILNRYKKTIHTRTWSLNVYKGFLRKTTQMMLETIGVYKYNLQTSQFAEAAAAADAPRVVNIITFEKSWPYLLKYIAYHFRGARPDTAVFVFCDEESEQWIRETAPAGRNRGSVTRSTPRNRGRRSRPREPLFHLQLQADAFALSPEEESLLANLAIYMVVSYHPLMKGIGGKRAVVQEYNYIYSRKNPDYTCLTIDDNITGFYEKSAHPCDYRRLQSKEIPLECKTYDLMQVYDMLEQIMNANPSIHFAGVFKGNGVPSEAGGDASEISSNTIYKLNLSRPAWLLEQGYVYNPFFTTFFEDIAFNLELDRENCAKLNVFLRFGHVPATHGTGECDRILLQVQLNDQNDDFPEFVLPPRRFQRLEPFYIMYMLYFDCLYKEGNLVLKADYKNKVYYEIYGVGQKLGGKYKCFQCPLFLMLLLYFASRRDPLLDLCVERNEISSSLWSFTNYGVLYNIIEEDSDGTNVHYTYKYSNKVVELLELFDIVSVQNGDPINPSVVTQAAEWRKQIVVLFRETYDWNPLNEAPQKRRRVQTPLRSAAVSSRSSFTRKHR